MTKKSRQKFTYLEKKKSFLDEIKSMFHHLLRAFSCQKKTFQTFKLLSDFFTCEHFPKKKFQRGNQLVQKKKVNKERKEYYFVKTVTAQKGRINFKASKVSNNYDVIILCKKDMYSFFCNVLVLEAVVRRCSSR